MTKTTFRRTVPVSLGTWLLVSFSALLTSVQGLATPANDSAGPHLSAAGHAETVTQADIALLTISVTSQSRQESEATRANAARTDALLHSIKGLKIADRDIQTADYTVGRQFNSSRATPTLIGYEVTNTVRITLRDLSQVSRLIDLATQSGATRVTALTYDLADRQAVEKETLTRAVTDARSRAQVIAAAMNMALGSLRSVTDSAGPSFQTQVSNGDAGFGGYPGSSRVATPISPQAITSTADVTVDYDLSVIK